MSDSKPFSDYHRVALSALARDIARAQAKRETDEILRRAKQPLPRPMCPPKSHIDKAVQAQCFLCNGSCDGNQHCPIANSEQPSPRVRTWLAEESNAMAAMLPPTWLQRMKTKLRLFVDGWIDPTVRS